MTVYEPVINETREQLLERIKTRFGVDKILFLDFETYYKLNASGGEKSFTLGNRTYFSYILDERFQTTGLGYAFDLDDWKYVYKPEDVEAAVDSWVNLQLNQGYSIAVVAHNTQFDASILTWRYGFKADFYFCTQLMRILNAPHKKKSLAATCEDLFPDNPELRKGKELANYDGVRLEDIPLEHQDPNNPDTLASYCVNDNHLLREIFFRFMQQGFPENELELMHITLRAAVEPQFKIDRKLLSEVVSDEEEKENAAIEKALEFCSEHNIEVDDIIAGDEPRKLFSSNDRYKVLLERFDITVPLKMNDKFEYIPALGKNDPEYIKSQIENPNLKPLYVARETVKSTIAKSRANKMISVADMFEAEEFLEADMPMFLNYYGALNTGRWSGGQKLNQQNLQRKSKHRLSMVAPHGYVITVNDLSNIELRANLWFCEQTDIVQRFKNEPDFDAYAELASEVYGYKVLKDTHPDERQLGKAGELGLGYAMSWGGFQNYLAGGPLGLEPMFVSDSFAKNMKLTYEATKPGVVSMWNFIKNRVLPVLAEGGEISFGPNNCVTARKDQIILPSGRILHYPNCKIVGEETQFGVRMSYSCDSHKRDRWQKPIPRRLWHGLIIENIIQSISRDILGHQKVRINRDFEKEKIGHVIGSVHDEVLGCVKAPAAEYAMEIMRERMAVPPPWANGLPLASEGGYDVCYSK